MSLHHGRSKRRVAALVTVFATAALVVQLSAFAASAVSPADARYIDFTLATADQVAVPATPTVVIVDVADVALAPVAGVTVTFTETGPGTITSADADAVLPGVQVVTGVPGTASVTVNTAADQYGVEEITATIDPALTSCDVGDGYCTASTTVTWQGAARFIDVSPDTATNVSGAIHLVTATVTDVSGSPVAGEVVTFTETGTGFFVAGQDEVNAVGWDGVQVTTDASGEAQVATTTYVGQAGDEEISATIDQSLILGPLPVPPAANDCLLGVNVPVGAAAGICDETVDKTWTTTPPPPVTHARTITLRLRDSLIAKGKVTVTDAFAACADSVTVQVQKKVSGVWVTKRTITTSSTGAYSTTLRNRSGKYRALAPEVLAGTDTCLFAKSLRVTY